MWRSLFLASLAGCACGPPAEPLIQLDVTLGSPPPTNHFIHVAMYDPSDQFLNAGEIAVSMVADMKWHYTLGDCDGIPQQSGSFPVRAWLSSSPTRDMRPAAPDIQATDVIDVTCTSEAGCVAMRAALLPLR